MKCEDEKFIGHLITSHWVPKKAALLCLLSLRGVIKNGKNLLFFTIWGGSEVFTEIFQNNICIGTVHKCDETHNT